MTQKILDAWTWLLVVVAGIGVVYVVVVSGPALKGSAIFVTGLIPYVRCYWILRQGTRSALPGWVLVAGCLVGLVLTLRGVFILADVAYNWSNSHDR